MGATYADTGLDLSERHLIFFSMNPITEDQNESQSGEGLYHLGGEGNNDAACQRRMDRQEQLGQRD